MCLKLQSGCAPMRYAGIIPMRDELPTGRSC